MGRFRSALGLLYDATRRGPFWGDVYFEEGNDSGRWMPMGEAWERFRSHPVLWDSLDRLREEMRSILCYRRTRLRVKDNAGVVEEWEAPLFPPIRRVRP